MPHPDELADDEPRTMPAEFQYMLIVAAIFAVLLLAGLPGQEPPQAGERSSSPPRREWATRWSAQQAAPAAQDAQPAAQVETPSDEPAAEPAGDETPKR